MRQWISSSLVQVMACCLFSAKPLSEPIMTYYQLNHTEKKTLGKFESKHVDLHLTKWIWNVHRQNTWISYIFINVFILSLLSIYFYDNITNFEHHVGPWCRKRQPMPLRRLLLRYQGTKVQWWPNGLCVHANRNAVMMRPQCVNRIALHRWDSCHCGDNWYIFGDCPTHID